MNDCYFAASIVSVASGSSREEGLFVPLRKFRCAPQALDEIGTRDEILADRDQIGIAARTQCLAVLAGEATASDDCSSRAVPVGFNVFGRG